MTETESKYSEELLQKSEESSKKSEETLNKPSPQEEKLNKILSEQSSQMLSLVAIANAHSKENNDLKVKNQNLAIELAKVQNEKNDLQSLFNMQTLLFVLLILVLIWMYSSAK